MPSFQPIPLNFEYTPQGLDELLVPLSLYKQEYDKRVADIDTRRDGLAAFAPYMNEMAPEARARYEALNRRIEDNMQYIGKPGYLLHERPIVQLKSEYGRTVADFKNAVRNFEEQKARAVQERAKHPNLVYNFRDSEGELVGEPSLDNYLDNGTLDFVSVDADDMMNKAASLAKGVSSRLAAASAGAYVSKRLDPVYGNVVEWRSKENGAPVILSLDWLLHPELHKEEIRRFRKQHPGREYQQLFESSVANDIESLKGHTAYDALDDANKRRVDDAIMFGFDSGLGPYNVDRTENWGPSLQPKGGSGGGGDVTPWEPRAVKTKPQVYVTDTQDTDEEEEYRDVMRYFGADDSSFWQTGDVPLPSRLSLFRGARGFGDGRDRSEADKLVNGDSFGKLTEAGVNDWFSMFDEDGRLMTRDKFKQVYGKNIDTLNSFEYVSGMRGNADIGDLYGRLLNDALWCVTRPGEQLDPTLGTTASGVYYEMSKAMLAAFEVPKGKREEILSDPSDKKFDEWADKENITEGKLKGKLLDLADRYANTQRDLMQFRFASDNEGILKDVLEKSVNAEGKIDLKEITGYRFSRKDGPRRFITQTKDATFDEFGEIGEPKDFIYKIPADPSEGLIIKNMTTGKEYLVPAKNLGSLYDNGEVEENTELIKELQGHQAEIIKQMRRKYDKISEIESDRTLSLDKKAELQALLNGEIKAMQNDYNLMQGNIAQATSNIVKTVQDKLSSSYKAKSY